MLKPKGLRAYTTGLLVAFTLIFSSLFLAVGVLTAYIVEDTLIMRLVGAQVAQIEQSLAQGESPQLNAKQRLYTEAADIPSAWQETILKYPSGELFTDAEDHYHFQHISTPSGDFAVLVVEVSEVLVVTESPRAFIIFVVVFAVMVLVAVGVALKIANRVTKPVLDLSTAVAQRAMVTEPMPDLPFELKQLASNFEASFSKIEQMLQRERDFTTDVGHELKTPLTAFNNLLVIASGRSLSSAEVEQLGRINADLANTVEVLLALAREESLTKQPVNVMACIEQLAIDQPQVVAGEFSIALTGDRSVVIQGNPVLTKLLFLNVIQNAIRHADSPQLNIDIAPDKIVLANSASSRKQLDYMAPGVRDETSTGVGQGLYLVRRIAEKLALRVELNLGNEQFEIVVHT